MRLANIQFSVVLLGTYDTESKDSGICVIYFCLSD
jgi:hypothetical protein